VSEVQRGGVDEVGYGFGMMVGLEGLRRVVRVFDSRDKGVLEQRRRW
jgi:hypothetical protein